MISLLRIKSIAVAMEDRIYYGIGRRIPPVKRLIKNNTMNTTNKTCAIHAEVPASPEKPNAAAMIATIRNIKAQYNMTISFSWKMAVKYRSE
jgi:hypothetical protein